jgi:Carboxypeptidase regulatory-like domain/TonB dependent receptor
LPWKERCVLKYFSAVLIAVLIPVGLLAQAPQSTSQATAPSTLSTSATTGTLHGQVTDPSGAVVANATVAILVSGGQPHSATTGRTGAYEIGGLQPGKYTVTVNSQGFAIFVQSDVDVAAGRITPFNIALEIDVEKEKVNVEAEGPTLDTNPANNASAIVLSGKDLESLPDDPDELQSDLEALAGPSAGPNGGQLYIDGFTAGQLPPKSSIREIRINQNPFSAEYDKLGYGRIEVFTKPGTDKFHGQFSVVGNSSGLNTGNPFLDGVPEEPYDSVIYQGNIGGPINKKASFFFDLQRRNIDEVAVVTALNLAQPETIPNPHTRTNLSPRIDYQVSANNSLTARYQFYRDTQQNAGVGALVLPEAGYNTDSTEHTVQITDTQIIGTKAINETRFQYLRENDGQTALSTAVGINVPGAFTGGGSSEGNQTDHQDHYEFQNYTSLSLGKHFVKFGGRLRAIHETNFSSAGFNGNYSFSSLTQFNQGIPNQYTVSTSPSGIPATVPLTMVDAGLYIQDDWKLRPNITLSGGLRFETQSDIHDHADWAPRLGFAWGIGGGGKNAPKTVLRGGFGLFYERFTDDLILNADRQNGIIQQQFVVPDPTYPAPPPLVPTTQSIYQINPELHAPYIIQTAFSLERQVTKIANVTLSYLNARGVRQLVSLNTNAPPPGTPGSDGPPPFPNSGPINQYTSDGLFRQNQLIANFNVRAGARLSLFGYYSLNYANSDTSSASSFPSNQYNLAGDYGRATFAIRDRIFFGGTLGLPYAFRLSPFMIFSSGTPYNVTVGQDLNNDTIFNDRPAFANNLSCPSPTQACYYNPTPTASQTLIPVNYLTGPNHFTLNLRLSKSFGFGPELGAKGGAQAGGGPPAGGGGGGPRGGGGGGGGGFGRGGGGGPGGFGGGPSTNHRYNLTFSVNARNVFNKVNAATPIGNLTSPSFGESVALAGGAFSTGAANRKIELQAMFTF